MTIAKYCKQSTVHCVTKQNERNTKLRDEQDRIRKGRSCTDHTATL